MYVDAYTETDWDEILVVERDNSGKRREITYPKKLIFYYDDPKGKHISIFGTKVTQFKTTSQKAFQKELKLCGKRTYESSINPIFRCLSENYQGLPAPQLNVALFDIEVDMDPQRGYASPNDPFAAVTAISVALAWENRVITLALAPKTYKDESGKVVPLTKELAKAICDSFPNTYLCDSEEQLLEAFLEIIEDADVISGWNSTGFDIPYLVNRIELKLSKDHTRKMCLWNLTPRKRVYTKFGKEHFTYDLMGRIHMDYLDLYMKHSPQQLHSYRLDFVAQIEVKAKKTPYEGSLYDLYHKDFRKFVEYNRQDVHLLVELDKKCKYIEVANQLAHANCVLLPNTLGSVILIDQAIVNEAHRLGMVVPDRKRRDVSLNDDDVEDNDDMEHETVVGAYVANPKVGIHDWVGACDINSLYPSVIRSFNMGPETIVAQLRPTLTNEYVKQATENKVSDVWAEIFGCLEYEEVINKTNVDLIVDFENGDVKQMKAYEVYEWIFNAKPQLCITANGTIFSYEKMGVIPSLLEKWYSERKDMQKKSKDLFKFYSNGLEIDRNLANELKNMLNEQLQ